MQDKAEHAEATKQFSVASSNADLQTEYKLLHVYMQCLWLSRKVSVCTCTCTCTHMRLSVLYAALLDTQSPLVCTHTHEHTEGVAALPRQPVHGVGLSGTDHPFRSHHKTCTVKTAHMNTAVVM